MEKKDNKNSFKKKVVEEKIEDVENNADVEDACETPSQVIERLESEINDYICVAQRIKAEFDNYRKRNDCLTEKVKENASEMVILDFLDILDSFDSALNLIEDEKSKAGVELILKQFQSVLRKYNVEEINPLDKPFDPELHNAIMPEKVEGKEGIVVQVLKKGYLRNKKVIRHAMVKVGA